MGFFSARGYRVHDGDAQHDVVCVFAAGSLGLNSQGDVVTRPGVQRCREGHRVVSADPSFQEHVCRRGRVEGLVDGGSDGEVSSYSSG